jgi:hypothetical protein
MRPPIVCGKPAGRGLALIVVGYVDRGRVLAALQHHLQPLRVEADDEVLAVRDDGHAGATGQLAPLPELEDVFGDVGFLELATVFSQPILGEATVGSGGRGVDLDLGHNKQPDH